VDGLRRVHADESNTLASSQHQRISVYDSLNVFKLTRCYAWIWWIKESSEERDNDETGERPFPADPAERENEGSWRRILHVCGEGVKATAM
jgi:hypothetical protein